MASSSGWREAVLTRAAAAAATSSIKAEARRKEGEKEVAIVLMAFTCSHLVSMLKSNLTILNQANQSKANLSKARQSEANQG